MPGGKGHFSQLQAFVETKIKTPQPQSQTCTSKKDSHKPHDRNLMQSLEVESKVKAKAAIA